MSAGSIGCLAHIQIEHHRVAGIADRGGMSPGVLGVEHEMVLSRPDQLRVMFSQIWIEPLAQVESALGITVMFDRVGR